MIGIHTLRCTNRSKTILQIDQLDIEAGSFNALVGPNGAGKSTLLKSISGDIPYLGEIAFHGLPLRQWDPTNKARHLGFLPQASALNFPFLAHEVVSLGATPLTLSARETRQQVARFMSLADCAHLSSQRYTNLSGGEKQRVHVARVLLQLSQAEHPPLLLLDEPTSAQDLGQQHALLTLFRRLCTEQCYGVLAVLHDLNHVLAYCDQSCILHRGKLRSLGEPKTCLSEQNIEQYWGYHPEIVATPKTKRTAIL